MPSYKPVNSALRVLTVLQAVSVKGRSTLSEVARAAGLSYPTAVRFLETLESAGYVLKDQTDATYVVTGKVLDLSVGYQSLRELGVVAAPLLAPLQKEIGWPSDVAVFDRDAMVVAATSRAESRIFHPRPPGFRAPVLGTSLGLAYLAYCDPLDFKVAVEAAAGLQGPWNDLARDEGKLQQMLAHVRLQGYAVMNDHYSAQVYENAIWAVAVPILHEGTAIASLNLTMNREVSADTAASRYVSNLTRTADLIAAAVAKAREGNG